MPYFSVVATRFWMIWFEFWIGVTIAVANMMQFGDSGLKITPTLWGLDWSPSQNHFPRLGWWLKINTTLNIPTSHFIGNFKLSPLSDQATLLQRSPLSKLFFDQFLGRRTSQAKKIPSRKLTYPPWWLAYLRKMIFRTSPGGICSFPGGSRQ